MTARIKAKLRRLEIEEYKTLKGRYQGQLQQNGEEIHHLIEKRLLERCPALKKIFGHPDRIPSVRLPKGDHQALTNMWKDLIPKRGIPGYKRTIPREDIIKAAWKVYKNDPDLQRAILVALL